MPSGDDYTVKWYNSGTTVCHMTYLWGPCLFPANQAAGFFSCAWNIRFHQPISRCHVYPQASLTQVSPRGSFSSGVNQKFILDIWGFMTKVLWYDWRLEAHDGEGPTLVMGASMVIEWIRAIDECLLCELPGGTEAKQIIRESELWNKAKIYMCFF